MVEQDVWRLGAWRVDKVSESAGGLKRYATEIPRETWVFRDRQEAGQLLAEQLSRYREEKPIVLALPRGGVVVGYEIAHALGAPLDVVVARKLGTPGQPELALGAIAPGGVYVLNEDIIGWLDISEDEVEQIASQEAREMERRMRHFRGDRAELSLEGKTAILVDDGIATPRPRPCRRRRVFPCWVSSASSGQESWLCWRALEDAGLISGERHAPEAG